MLTDAEEQELRERVLRAEEKVARAAAIERKLRERRQALYRELHDLENALAEKYRSSPWGDAFREWLKCSSRRLSWKSGQHCCYCDPLRALIESEAKKAA